MNRNIPEENEKEEFICSFCYEICNEPKKEKKRRSTILGNINLNRLSVDIGSDIEKLRSILKIQALYRGYLARKQHVHIERIKKRHVAAIIIQKKIRQYINKKHAQNRRRVLSIWKKRAHQLTAVQNLQRTARKFIRRNQTFRETKLADVVSQFKFVDSEVADKMLQKAQEVKRLTENVQIYQEQVRGIEEILHSNEEKPLRNEIKKIEEIKMDEKIPIIQEIINNPPLQQHGSAKVHLDALCASVSRGLKMIHDRAARLREREVQLQQELEITKQRVTQMETRQIDPSIIIDVEEDDKDDWQLNQTPEEEEEKFLLDENNRLGRVIKRHNSVSSDIGSVIGSTWDLGAQHDHSHHHHIPIHGAEAAHATFELLSRMQTNSNVVSRQPKQISWLKELIADIYKSSTVHHDNTLQFMVWLSSGEFFQLRNSKQSSMVMPNICDTVYHHFQCTFGLPSLIDQAISDLSLTIQSFVSIDDDVMLFQSFLNGSRHISDLAFFCHVRTLVTSCGLLSDAAHRLPPLDSKLREVIDIPHALKIAYQLFRVAEESKFQMDIEIPGPKVRYAQFEKQLWERHGAYHSNSHHGHNDELIYFTDFFELLCRHHADTRISCLHSQWVQEQYQEIDLDNDDAISVDEFVSHMSKKYHAPKVRELRQIFQHATNTSDVALRSSVLSPRMNSQLFRATVLRMLRNKQLHINPNQPMPMNPTIRRELAQNIKLLHVIGWRWNEKKDDLAQHINQLFNQNGLERNLAAYLLHLREKFEAILVNPSASKEVSIDAWNLYSTIVCVLLALQTKVVKINLSTVENKLSELERIWEWSHSLNPSSVHPNKEDAILPPISVLSISQE